MLVAAAALVAFAAAYYVNRDAPPVEDRRADAARLMNELMSGRHPVGGPFTLTDQHGKKASLADFRDKVVLRYFGYTDCPDVCPTDLLAIGQAIASLGADGDAIQPIFITLDPARDTREVLAAYVASFHPRFIALSGTEAEIRRVARDYEVFFERVVVKDGGNYMIDHAAFTFLLDREGKFAGLFPPGMPTDRMTVMVREQLEAARR